MSLETGEQKSEKELDKLLGQIGGWGTYQYRLVALFVIFSMVSTYVAYTPVLFLYVPDHYCKIADNDLNAHPTVVENDALEEFGVDHFLLPEELGTQKRSQCFMPGLLDEEGKKVRCTDGWEYNTTEYFTSAATDMDWVCQDAWKGPLTQSMFYAGGVVGTLAFGVMGDHYGRFPAFFVSSALIFVAGLATPFCTDFISFTIMRFIMGLTYDSALSLFYLLALEYVSVERRSFIGNFAMAIGFSLGGVYQPWLLKWLKDWKIFHHILFAQSAIVFITPWLMHESVLWLSTQGKADKCKEILLDIADINGKKLAPNFFDKFEKLIVEHGEDSKRNDETSMWHLFKRPTMRRISIVMILTWVLISSLYDAHILNMSNLNQSIYIAFSAASLVEFPGDMAAIWGMDALGRRWSCFLGLLLSGICMGLSGWLYDTDLLLTIFATLGRFFITYALQAGMQYQFEVFPTQLRAQGSAIASVCVMIFQFFVPYIVYSANHSECLPFIILALLSFVGAALSLLLPETAEVELPDTVEEAEALLKKTRFFHVPVLANMTKNKKNNNKSDDKENKNKDDVDQEKNEAEVKKT